MELIDKSIVVAEIERKINNIDYEGLSDRNIGQKQSLYHILSFLDTLEIKEVDLDDIARHYLLHEHVSPLNEVLHQADLNTEMQYHKDIENAYKAGVELGLKAKGE